jgi:hypothetical protein
MGKYSERKTMNKNETKLVERLESLIFAAEVIDSQEPPPATEDVERLHAEIREARRLIRKIAKGS